MSEATMAPDGGQAGTEPEAVAPEGLADDSSSSPDPSDYLAKIRSDPEFAVAEVKRQQSEASRASDKLRKAELAVRMAETLGGGDVQAGANLALKELSQYRQLLQDPKMARFVERALNGERVADSLLDDDEMDPAARELSDVRGTQARLENQLAEMRFERAIEEFQRSKLGQSLSAEEMQEFLASARPSIQTWGQTPQGRQQLQAFSARQLQTLAADWMISTDKFSEVGERAARAKAERIRQQATDGPSRSTKIGPDAPPEAATPQQAWDYAVRKATGR